MADDIFDSVMRGINTGASVAAAKNTRLILDTIQSEAWIRAEADAAVFLMESIRFRLANGAEVDGMLYRDMLRLDYCLRGGRWRQEWFGNKYELYTQVTSQIPAVLETFEGRNTPETVLGIRLAVLAQVMDALLTLRFGAHELVESRLKAEEDRHARMVQKNLGGEIKKSVWLLVVALFFAASSVIGLMAGSLPAMIVNASIAYGFYWLRKRNYEKKLTCKWDARQQKIIETSDALRGVIRERLKQLAYNPASNADGSNGPHSQFYIQRENAYFSAVRGLIKFRQEGSEFDMRKQLVMIVEPALYLSGCAFAPERVGVSWDLINSALPHLRITNDSLWRSTSSPKQ